MLIFVNEKTPMLRTLTFPDGKTIYFVLMKDVKIVDRYVFAFSVFSLPNDGRLLN